MCVFAYNKEYKKEVRNSRNIKYFAKTDALIFTRNNSNVTNEIIL